MVSERNRASRLVRDAVLDCAADAGVAVIDDFPNDSRATGRPGRVSLVLGTHHSVAPEAQHRAMSCHARCCCWTAGAPRPAPLRLWLRPQPSVTLTRPDGRKQVVLDDLHLHGVVDFTHLEGEDPALVEVFAGPSGSGLLLAVTGNGTGAAVSLCSGPQTVHLPVPAPATVDGVTRTMPPRTYRIALAQPPLYPAPCRVGTPARDRMTR